MRTVAELNTLPGKLPSDCVAPDVDTSTCIVFLEAALANLRTEHTTSDLLWRDLFCLTGSVRTLSSAAAVAFWQHACLQRKPRRFVAKQPSVIRRIAGSSWIDVPFTFEAEPVEGMKGLCSGNAFVVPEEGDERWRIWVLITVLEQFEGMGNPDVAPIMKEAADGRALSGDYATTAPQASINGQRSLEPYYSVVIAGAGHHGLSLAGRLHALRISYLLVEKASQPGATWTQRNYESVKMHTVREQNHLPLGRLYEEDEPNMLPGENVAKGFERFVQRYGINILLETVVESVKRNGEGENWVVSLRFHNELKYVSTKHVAFGLGAWNTEAWEPAYLGKDEFEGELLHTSIYRHSRKWQNKRAVVIGSSTSAHDVAEDMLRAEVESVTLVQRSPTMVLPSEWFVSGVSALYNRSIPTEVADRKMATPWKISREMMQRPMRARMRQNPELFDSLERAGFRVDREVGFLDLAVTRAGGYYLDVGGSAKIISGEIKVKSDSPIERFTNSGLLFKNGSQLEADVIVFATGFTRNYAKQIESIVGESVASRIGSFWSLDEEGEQLNVMKPAVPGLWLFGGGPSHARWFSRFVALQIQADTLGKPFQKNKSID